jgi:hypothetical protein
LFVTTALVGNKGQAFFVCGSPLPRFVSDLGDTFRSDK